MRTRLHANECAVKPGSLTTWRLINVALTPKQQRFVDEYLVDLNATQAYKRAGYKVKNDRVAAACSAKLLANANVSHAIEEARKAQSERTQITADYVLKGLQSVAERCLQREPVMVWDSSSRSMVQAADEDGAHIWRFDSIGANRSFELLGKHLGLFDKKPEGNEQTLSKVDMLIQKIDSEANVDTKPETADRVAGE